MFKRRKNKDTDHPWTDKAASKIARAGIKVQTKFANTMNKHFSKIPQRKLKIVLAVFCVVSGGFSIYLAGHAIFGHVKVQPAYKVTPIERPRHFDKTGSEINEPGSVVTEEMYQEIQSYKRYMDSLKEPIRPGLMDSIRVLEQIYQTEPRNK